MSLLWTLTPGRKGIGHNLENHESWYINICLIDLSEWDDIPTGDLNSYAQNNRVIKHHYQNQNYCLQDKKNIHSEYLQYLHSVNFY
jgi:hypothetical protein